VGQQCNGSVWAGPLSRPGDKSQAGDGTTWQPGAADLGWHFTQSGMDGHSF